MCAETEPSVDLVEIPIMLRTIFSIGALAILGLIALKFVFGVFGGLVGILFVLLFLALKIAIIGALIYLVIRIVSPDTARRLREKFNG
jgi:hypothetical protein